MRNFRIHIPRGWDPPPEWRTRFRAIEKELEQPGSPLVRGLEEARLLADEVGERVAGRRLEQLRDEYPGLFPGEAGQRLITAVLCDVPPVLWARDTRTPATLPNGEATPADLYYRARNVFEQPTPEDPKPPRYKSPVQEPGRQRAYAARRPPKQRIDVVLGQVGAGPDLERLIELIEGDIPRRRAPLPYPQVAKKMRIKPEELHKELYRLRKRRGLTWIRNANEQEEYARFIGGLIRADLEHDPPGIHDTPPANPSSPA